MSIDEVKKYEFKCKVLGVEPLQINVCEEGIKTGRSKVDKDTIAITKFIDILGENTFSKKNKLLNKVLLNEKLKGIEKKAFFRCEELEDINLSNIGIVGKFAFMESGITDINLDDIFEIDSSAFHGCKGIKKIKLGK